MILNDAARLTYQASDLQFLVELRGFEPLTPSMRTRCATGLRYSPWNGCQRSKDRRMFRPSVSHGPVGRVRVLVVDLIADTARDVDDLGTARHSGRVRHGVMVSPGSGGRRGRNGFRGHP